VLAEHPNLWNIHRTIEPLFLPQCIFTAASSDRGNLKRLGLTESSSRGSVTSVIGSADGKWRRSGSWGCAWLDQNVCMKRLHEEMQKTAKVTQNNNNKETQNNYKDTKQLHRDAKCDHLCVSFILSVLLLFIVGGTCLCPWGVCYLKLQIAAYYLYNLILKCIWQIFKVASLAFPYYSGKTMCILIGAKSKLEIEVLMLFLLISKNPLFKTVLPSSRQPPRESWHQTPEPGTAALLCPDRQKLTQTRHICQTSVF